MLDAYDQVEIGLDGVHVGERQSELGVDVVCKQIDNFYVEFAKCETGWKYMRSFKNPDLLEPYLDQINIDGLGI